MGMAELLPRIADKTLVTCSYAGVMVVWIATFRDGITTLYTHSAVAPAAKFCVACIMLHVDWLNTWSVAVGALAHGIMLGIRYKGFMEAWPCSIL